jgi:hypothetical protein
MASYDDRYCPNEKCQTRFPVGHTRQCHNCWTIVQSNCPHDSEHDLKVDVVFQDFKAVNTRKEPVGTKKTIVLHFDKVCLPVLEKWVRDTYAPPEARIGYASMYKVMLDDFLSSMAVTYGRDAVRQAREEAAASGLGQYKVFPTAPVLNEQTGMIAVEFAICERVRP